MQPEGLLHPPTCVPPTAVGVSAQSSVAAPVFIPKKWVVNRPPPASTLPYTTAWPVHASPDHTRRTRHQKTRPNLQRDLTFQRVLEQLDLADASRPEAIRVANSVKRLATAVVKTSVEPAAPSAAESAVPTVFDDADDESVLLQESATVAQVDTVPVLAGHPACAARTSDLTADHIARVMAVSTGQPGSVLGPRDLSMCPLYTRTTDDLSCLSALPSSIFAQALINGHKIAAVVDTGARVTLLHGDVFDELPVSDRPALAPSHLKYVSAAGTSDFAVRGVARMCITIAGVSGDVLVTVCDRLHVQCLIGDDYLLRYSVSPCRDDLCVRSQQGTTPYHVFFRVGSGTDVRFVSANHDQLPVFTLPSLHLVERWVEAPEMLSEGEIVYIEPSPGATRRGIVAARVVCSVTNKRLKVQLVNTTDSDIQVFAHDEIAVLSTEVTILSDSKTALVAPVDIQSSDSCGAPPLCSDDDRPPSSCAKVDSARLLFCGAPPPRSDDDRPPSSALKWTLPALLIQVALRRRARMAIDPRLVAPTWTLPARSLPWNRLRWSTSSVASYH